MEAEGRRAGKIQGRLYVHDSRGCVDGDLGDQVAGHGEEASLSVSVSGLWDIQVEVLVTGTEQGSSRHGGSA